MWAEDRLSLKVRFRRPDWVARASKPPGLGRNNALLQCATSGGPPRPRANRLRGTRITYRPGHRCHPPMVNECDRAGNSRQIERRAVHPAGCGDAGRGGTPSRSRNSWRPAVVTPSASTTLPQHLGRHACLVPRRQTFRFRSGLLRMPPAGLEPATRCLEGRADAHDGR
jgi:hypothetical protein